MPPRHPSTDTHKGGRGKKAPYRTVIVRVPMALLPIVEFLKARYFHLVERGELQGTDDDDLVARSLSEVTADPVVTRNGKCPGDVKRACLALLRELGCARE